MIRGLCLIYTMIALAGCEASRKSDRLLEFTGRDEDVSLVGDSLFRLKDVSGAAFYADSGRVYIGEDLTLGLEICGKHYYFDPPVTVSHDTTRFFIETTGVVIVRVGQDHNLVERGRLPIVLVRSDGRVEMGKGLFVKKDDAIEVEEILDPFDAVVCSRWQRQR